jgi:hypothetical protein
VQMRLRQASGGVQQKISVVVCNTSGRKNQLQTRIGVGVKGF